MIAVATFPIVVLSSIGIMAVLSGFIAPTMRTLLIPAMILSATIGADLGRFDDRLVWITANHGAYESAATLRGLDEADARFFQEETGGAVFCSRFSRRNLRISHQGKEDIVDVTGVDPDFPRIFSLRLKNGRFIESDDIRFKRQVCVVSPDIAAWFFGRTDPVGKTLTVHRAVFTIVGITEKLARDSANSGAPPGQVFLPSVFIGSESRLGEETGYGTFWIEYDTPENASRAAPAISRYLEEKYGLNWGKPRFIVRRIRKIKALPEFRTPSDG